METSIDVILIAGDASQADIERALVSLGRQTFGEWRCQLVCEQGHPDFAGTDPRIERVIAGSGYASLLKAGIEAGSGEWVTWIGASDELAPRWLQTLAGSCEGEDGAICEYRHWTKIGPVPGGSLRDCPGLIGAENLDSVPRLPASAQVVRRELLTGVEARGRHAPAIDRAMIRGAAARGARWRVCPDALVRRHTRALADAADTLDELSELIEVAGVWGDDDRDLIEAFVSLHAFESGVREDGGEGLAQAVRFGNLFATWWQRLGFLGPAPVHVLRDLAPGFSSTALTQAQAASLLASEIRGAEHAHLIGLGKNARALARELQAMGIRMSGRDDHLTSSPDWAAEDGIEIEFVTSDAPFDPSSRIIVTPASDGAIVDRLASDLEILRWSDAPRLAVRRAMAELGSRGLREPKPMPAGVSA